MSIIGCVMLAACCCEEKVYLSPAQVEVLDTQLRVFLEGEWEPAESLFSDAGGLFVYVYKPPNSWFCNFCVKRHTCQQACPFTGQPPPRDCK